MKRITRQDNMPGKATAENLRRWSDHASSNSYARGGKIKMTAGARSGVGRLQKAHHEAGKR